MQRWTIPAPFVLSSGEDLDPNAFLAYECYGSLNDAKSNAILWVTCYGQRTSEMSALIGSGKRFDPSRYFIITVNMLGNGLSFSPTTPGAKWPRRGLTYTDNARAQQLLISSLGIQKLALIYGFSMGAMLALEYCVQHPEAVSSAVVVCGSARTGAANRFFLQGLHEALRADPEAELDTQDPQLISGFGGNPRPAALKRFAAIYADWIFDAPLPAGGGSPNASRPAFAQSPHAGQVYGEGLYKQVFGVDNLEAFQRIWEKSFSRWDALEYYVVSDTWLRGNVSDNPVYEGDLQKALGAIRALVYMMPGSTDQYFVAAEIAEQARMIPNCVLSPLESPMGHVAESAADMQPQIQSAIQACLEKAEADSVSRL